MYAFFPTLFISFCIIQTHKPIFHWKRGSRWLPNTNEFNTKKHEVYIPNAKILRLGTNATYIPLTCVWVLRWVTQCFCVLRYQHVGIGNSKLSHWGSNPMPGPNVRVFVPQWNIGYSRILLSLCALPACPTPQPGLHLSWGNMVGDVLSCKNARLTLGKGKKNN